MAVVIARVEERAELVALDVGERDPRRMFGKHTGAEIQQRRDVADVDVKMHPVLHRLGAVLRAEREKRPLRRHAERGRPERLGGRRVDGVDDSGPA